MSPSPGNNRSGVFQSYPSPSPGRNRGGGFQSYPSPSPGRNRGGGFQSYPSQSPARGEVMHISFHNNSHKTTQINHVRCVHSSRSMDASLPELRARQQVHIFRKWTDPGETQVGACINLPYRRRVSSAIVHLSVYRPTIRDGIFATIRHGDAGGDLGHARVSGGRAALLPRVSRAQNRQ